MNINSRIRNAALQRKVMTAEDAAALIPADANIGMSGFTGSGYPKAVPNALASRVSAASSRGEALRFGVWTGASTAPELDGSLAAANAIGTRLPYQSDSTCRKRINSGEVDYLDMHLSHVAQFVWFGQLGKLDTAVVEVAGIREDGSLIPTTSIGNNKTWLDLADNVILEVNSTQSLELEGMHDIYYGTRRPPERRHIPIFNPGDRVGSPYFQCDPDKVIAVVETDASDRNSAFSAPDEDSRKIAGHILEFFEHEVSRGRLPKDLLPLQSGVGNIANAVMAGLNEGKFNQLTAYTEVLQDGMLDMLLSDKLKVASATAFSLSPAGLEKLYANIDSLRRKILLRPQEISNHPEVIRRLGVVSMNGMIEADIYGNVNSTHIMGSQMMNGIGGSGDFARNAYTSIFMTPSQAKGGLISCIVPMVSHVDHTEHDVQILVTEQGLADLRGLSPKQRAKAIIDKCAHPKFKPVLQDYFNRAMRDSPGKHTPHLMEEVFHWHLRYLKNGAM